VALALLLYRSYSSLYVGQPSTDLVTKTQMWRQPDLSSWPTRIARKGAKETFCGKVRILSLRRPTSFCAKKSCGVVVLQEYNTSVQKPLVRIMYSFDLALHYNCDLRIGQNTVHNQHLWLDKPIGLYSTHEYPVSSCCSRSNPFYDS